MPRLRLLLLGSPRIELDGQPVKVETRKVMALLAFLAITNESHRRDSLVNLLWPEADMTHGRAVLRRTLSALNSALPEGWLDSDRETIGLNPGADFWLDVRAFRQDLAACRSHGHPESQVCLVCQERLAEAVALYRDDFMSGFSLGDSFNFDDWQFFQAETLRQELGAALGKLAQCQVLARDFQGAIQHTRRWLLLDRLNEDANCALMQVYAWTGQRSAALRQYQECREVLRSQLGVEPQKATNDLQRAIESGRLPPLPSNPAWQAAGAVPPTKEVPPLTQVEAVEEKRILTVLFCQIYPPVPLPEAASLVSEDAVEDIARLVRPFLDQVRQSIGQFGGHLNARLGESVLATFGLAAKHENDPELAVRAAIQIREQAGQNGLSLAVGISTGEVYLHPEQEGRTGEFNLSGAQVNLVLSLAGQAQPGQILCAPSTYQLTRGSFNFTPLSLPARKGNPVSVYQVEGLRMPAGKTHGIEGLRTTMVGREMELSTLQQILQRVMAGQGQAAAIIGEAGLGKSRLVAEFRRAVTAPGQPNLLWLEGRSLELGTNASYWPFVDMPNNYFALQVVDKDRLVGKAIAVGMGQLAEAGVLSLQRGQEITELFNRLLSLPASEQGVNLLDNLAPEEVRQRTFLAIQDFFQAQAQRQPLVMVLEDLHWADQLSLDLVFYLLDALPSERLLLLCVYRPEREYRTDHISAVAERKCRQCWHEIHLRELSQAESYQMIEGLLGSKGLAEPIKVLIWNRCQGTPFYIEEVVQSLADAGILTRENEAWHLSGGFDASLLPASIQNVILSRLDHLNEDWKGVLQTAAVIGRVFRQRILEQAISPGMDLAKILWGLEELGMIYQERSIPEVEYSFCHVLMQEAIYHNILRHRRKAMHQHTAEAIEALYAANLDSHCEELAFHYEKSGNIKQAVAYLFQAGEKARRNYANEAAIAYLNQGLDLLRSLPETAERNRQELAFLLGLGVPLVHKRGHAASEVLNNYQQARALSEKLNDETQLFNILLGLVRHTLTSGNISQAYELNNQMLALADRRQDPFQQSRAYMMRAENQLRAGRYISSLEDCHKGLALCEQDDPSAHTRLYGNDTRLGCHIYMSESLCLLGYPDQAQLEAQRVLALANTTNHPFSRVHALAFMAEFYLLLGEVAMVKKLVHEASQIAREREFILYQSMCKAQSGWATAASGQVEEGIERIKQAIADMNKANLSILQPNNFAYLVDALARVNRLDESLEAVEAGLEIVVKSGENYWLAELQRLKGEILCRRKAFSEAEDCFKHALAVAHQQQARWWELRTAASLARLWQQQGKITQAYEILAPVYHWFSEGFDTIDLKAARALLDELG